LEAPTAPSSTLLRAFRPRAKPGLLLRTLLQIPSLPSQPHRRSLTRLSYALSLQAWDVHGEETTVDWQGQRRQGYRWVGRRYAKGRRLNMSRVGWDTVQWQGDIVRIASPNPQEADAGLLGRSDAHGVLEGQCARENSTTATSRILCERKLCRWTPTGQIGAR